MPRSPRQTRSLNLAKAQAGANAAAHRYLETTIIVLPEMPEEQYIQTMGSITQALVHLYAQGYQDGVEKKHHD